MSVFDFLFKKNLIWSAKYFLIKCDTNRPLKCRQSSEIFNESYPYIYRQKIKDINIDINCTLHHWIISANLIYFFSIPSDIHTIHNWPLQPFLSHDYALMVVIVHNSFRSLIYIYFMSFFLKILKFVRQHTTYKATATSATSSPDVWTWYWNNETDNSWEYFLVTLYARGTLRPLRGLKNVIQKFKCQYKALVKRKCFQFNA